MIHLTQQDFSRFLDLQDTLIPANRRQYEVTKLTNQITVVKIDARATAAAEVSCDVIHGWVCLS